jgi:3'-5' exoribonuclease
MSAETPRPLTVAALKALNRTGNPPFSGVYVLRKIATRTARNDNLFLILELGDKTGSFSCNLFGDHPSFATVRALTEGVVVRVEGKLDYFQERLSPRIARLDLVPEADVKADPTLLDLLVESSPEDPAALWAECEAHLAAIVHPELRATVQGVFDEAGPAFRTVPAAIAMHHAYRAGLLEHTVRMARAARALLPLYPEVDPDLALAGVLVHDTGKTIEYEVGLATRKTRRGLLHGHVVLGYQLVRKAGLRAKLHPDLLERLEHIVLSHQGELEWGAAVMAATPEAVFVSMVDNLDARLGMVQRALRQGGEHAEFSDYLPGLKASVLLAPPAPTNDSAAPPDSAPTGPAPAGSPGAAPDHT